MKQKKKALGGRRVSLQRWRNMSRKVETREEDRNSRTRRVQSPTTASSTFTLHLFALLLISLQNRTFTETHHSRTTASILKQTPQVLHRKHLFFHYIKGHSQRSSILVPFKPKQNKRVQGYATLKPRGEILLEWRHVTSLLTTDSWTPINNKHFSQKWPLSKTIRVKFRPEEGFNDKPLPPLRRSKRS